MSKDALAGFMSKLAQDSTLQDELRGLAEGSGEEAAVPTEAFVEFAQGKGFEFTTDEALGVFEMGDDELDSVSGGAVFAKYDMMQGDVWKNKVMQGGYKNRGLPLSMFNRFNAGYKF